MTTTRSASYALVPVSPVLGAEVAGIDLANGVDESTAAALREDFWRHKILVFRNQDLSPDAHVEAVRIFDEPFDHPLWLHRDPDNRLVYTFDLEQAGGASTWHVGGTWRNPPFNIESLTYEVVPEIGGRTLWADLQAAYDGLSGPFKVLLEKVSAVYSAYPGDGSYNRPPVTETIEHPVVRTHRHTGRKGLFLSSSAIRLTGIEPNEGQAILPFLLAHASSPNYTVGFGWNPATSLSGTTRPPGTSPSTITRVHAPIAKSSAVKFRDGLSAPAPPSYEATYLEDRIGSELHS